MMNTLFPVEPVLPEGFTYVPDFISEQEEAALIAVVSGLELQTFVFQGFTAKRNFASFGADYRVDSRRLTPGEPIPVAFAPLISKVKDFLAVRKEIAKLLVRMAA
jgi:hypothetical protein